MTGLGLLAALALGQAAPPPHEVKVAVGKDVAPSPKVQLMLNTRNVPSLHLDARPVDPVAWMINRDDPDYLTTHVPHPIGPPASSWNAMVRDPKQPLAGPDNYFSRQVNLPPLKPGVYLITATGGGQTAYAVVNVTDLAVVVKRSKTKLLAWVTDFKTGSVLSDAQVAFYDKDLHRLAASVTKSDGACVLTGANSTAGTVVVRHGRDFAGLESGAADDDGTLRALFQTDRPIYRPGQTIFYKAVLRLIHGRKYDVPANRRVTVRLRDARDNPLDEKETFSTPSGTISGQFRIPQEAITGPYTLFLNMGSGLEAYQTVSVAAYRKPEFKVETVSSKRRYLAGENVSFKLSSQFFFGAPLPGAHVRWVAHSSWMPFFTPEGNERWFYGGDGNMYPNDDYAGAPFSGEGEAVTDKDGIAQIEFTSDPNAGDREYSVEFMVEDNSRRVVTANASVPVYSANIRIGLTSPAVVTPLGKLVPIQVSAMDLDGHPKSANVTLRLIEPVVDPKTGQPHDHVLTTRTVLVPESGKVMINLPAAAEGELRLEAEAPDGTGRKARARMTVSVVGIKEPAVTENDNPNVQLKLDRRIYKPGDTATAFVETNRRKGPILVVEEGREIFNYRVLPAGSSKRNWKLPVSVEESPNAYLSACEWVDGQNVSTNVILPVPDETRRLTVTAQPQKKELAPGERQLVFITTKDSDGHPVSAEVSLAVVDEAIYAMSEDTTPDPYGFYWGLRPNFVQTASSAPAESEGGAYQRTNSLAPVRTRFEDTAFWNPFILTHQDGRAAAEFETPGNLTTWRITARAVTNSTQVGTARSDFVATRPLTLRMATPTLVAKGDTFTLIGTLNNRTAQDLSERVFLRPEGIQADDLDQLVTVPAHGQAEVHWHLRATEIPLRGFFRLTARAEGPSANLSDALTASVPIVPRGVQDTSLGAGTFKGSATVTLPLGPNPIDDGATLDVRVFAGLSGLATGAAQGVFSQGRFGSPAAANALIAAVATKLPGTGEEVVEALAMLSRMQQPDGWGWWDNAPSDSAITAQVVHALAVAKANGIRIFDHLRDAADAGAWAQYGRSALWDRRAQLAASLLEIGSDHGMDAVEEVQNRGMDVSPFGKLRLAEALIAHNRAAASKTVDELLPLVSRGPGTAFVPVGDGLGWVANSTETTAELLTVLALLNDHADLQDQLANYLALNQAYRSSDDNAAIARAVALYASHHPIANNPGAAVVTVDGHKYALTPSTVEPSLSVHIPLPKLTSDPIRIERSGDGEVFYSATLNYYRGQLFENATGIRVSRRYELRNAAGVWKEADRPVHPGEPVRCTVTIWGDDIPDALRIREPIPTGFQFTEAEQLGGSYQDVRDGAVVHYVTNAGAPFFFRYYLRAETDGQMIALPATGEYLRRPSDRGQSASIDLTIKK